MTDTEELSRGEALARVAVLEAELAELRKRVCVPEGYVVVPVEPSAGHLDSMAMRMRHDFGLLPEYLKERFRGDARQLYEECTGQGLYKLPAAPAPVERNQCDGCQAGIQIENGMHRMGKPGWYPDLMACTADRYGSAPVERVEQEAKVFWVLFDNTGGEKYIKKDADAGTLAFFDNEEDAARAKRFNPGTDYKRVEYYTTPQPAPTACTGKTYGSTDPKLRSADCFAEHEQAIAPTAAPPVPKVTSAMKAEFIGEFFWDEEAPYYDEDGELHDHVAQRVVPWDLCKRIYKEMAGFALANGALTATAAQDVSGLPFVRKILEKLERFRECAEDDEGVDIGRHWLDILTRLGLLNRVQRSPARWEMTAQADDALETAHQQREEQPHDSE